MTAAKSHKMFDQEGWAWSVCALAAINVLISVRDETRSFGPVTHPVHGENIASLLHLCDLKNVVKAESWVTVVLPLRDPPSAERSEFKPPCRQASAVVQLH